MSIDSEGELRGLLRAGRAVARTIAYLKKLVRPGITTGELDARAAEMLASEGARSAPKLVYDFPGHTCISLNEEAVHGIPGPRALRAGDLVTLDVTAELDGFYADAAITLPVGTGSAQSRGLCEAAEAAFWKAAAVARAGAPLSSVGREVENEVRRRGFFVLRELCGHGVGRDIHEEPNVLNYYDPFVRTRLTRGLVIALEPIIAASPVRTRLAGDGWTVRSADRSLTAHFEHTIVITRRQPVIVTAA
ncbi:MAG TPA: type I methionyl aminopeptidase [Longimicrobiales bacterium]|nr:type I methionyl aminopeptidase [Longimicrobiales bacterium]